MKEYYYVQSKNVNLKSLIVKLVLLCIIILTVVGIILSPTNHNIEIVSDVVDHNWDEIIDQYEINDITNKIKTLNPFLREVDPELPYAIRKYSEYHDIPVDILISLIFIESSFRKYAVSYKDCVGYMQLNYKVHLWIDRERMFETDYNIYAGTKILSMYKSRSRTWEDALIRYNGWVTGSGFGSLVLNTKRKINTSI